MSSLNLAFQAQRAWDVDNDVELARKLFEQALEKDEGKQDSWVHTLFAQFLECTKNEESKVSGHYTTALELEPLQPLALGNYAMYLHKKVNKKEAALRLYQRSSKEYASHTTVQSKMANLLKGLGRNLKEVENIYSSALKANESHPDCLGNYAVLKHGTQQDFDRAEQLYRAAYEADSMHVNNLSNYGLFLTEVRGDHKTAQKLYARSLTVNPSHSNSLYNYAVLHDSALKDPIAAKELYRRAVKANPNHAFAWYNLAILLEETSKEDYDEAENAYRNCVRANPHDAMALCDFGYFLFRVRKDFAESEKLIRKSISLRREEYPQAWCRLGDIHGAKGVHKEAMKAYERAIKIDSRHSESLAKLARLYGSVLTDTDMALQFYKRAISCRSCEPGYLSDYADFLADTVSKTNPTAIEEARKIYERAVKEAPRDPHVLHNFSVFLIRQKEFDKALELLEKAYQVKGNQDPDCSTQLALLLWQYKKDTNRACRILEGTIKQNPDYAAAKEHYNKLKVACSRKRS